MSVVTDEIKGIDGLEDRLNIGSPPPPTPPKGDAGDGDTGEPFPSFPVSKGQLGLWLALTAIAMLFAGLSSAYIVMRGAPSWQNVALPGALWVNTFVLLASSVTIEWARRRVQVDRMGPTKFWMGATAGLGLVFPHRTGRRLETTRQCGCVPTDNTAQFFFIYFDGRTCAPHTRWPDGARVCPDPNIAKSVHGIEPRTHRLVRDVLAFYGWPLGLPFPIVDSGLI